MVAYLDIGTGGYIDLGSELPDETLLRLPKGRHALVIAGTFGIDGYVAAKPSPTPQADSQPAPVLVYPPLPEPFIGVQNQPWGGHAEVIRSAIGEDGVIPCFTAGQMVAYADATHAARAPADSVQEDAARYRWLREGNDAKHGAAWHVAVNLYGCEWDAAIDTARKQGANHDI